MTARPDCPLCGSQFCPADATCPARPSPVLACPLEPIGADSVRCPGCSQIVDVGWELREHRRQHRAMADEVER